MAYRMTAKRSPHYQTLIDLHAQLHRDGADGRDAQDVFAGKSLLRHIPAIRALAVATKSTTLLDYGSGKGAPYFRPGFYKDPTAKYATALEAMGLESVRCYDPAVPDFAKLPDGPFDGVISTDVLEHLHEADVPAVLREIFERAQRFVFMDIASFRARKTLPNGANAHSTIRPARWWREQILRTPKRSGVVYQVEIHTSGRPDLAIMKALFPWTRSVRGVG
jgi:hypothetical protein